MNRICGGKSGRSGFGPLMALLQKRSLILVLENGRSREHSERNHRNATGAISVTHKLRRFERCELRKLSHYIVRLREVFRFLEENDRSHRLLVDSGWNRKIPLQTEKRMKHSLSHFLKRHRFAGDRGEYRESRERILPRLGFMNSIGKRRYESDYQRETTAQGIGNHHRSFRNGFERRRKIHCPKQGSKEENCTHREHKIRLRKHETGRPGNGPKSGVPDTSSADTQNGLLGELNKARTRRRPESSARDF